MRAVTRVLLLAGIGAGAGVVPLAVIGCMGEGTRCPPPPVVDAAGDAPHDGGDAEAAGPAIAGIRLANLSPDVPLVDFCIAPHGTTMYQGPLLLGLAGALAGAGMPVTGTPGVPSPQFSAYVTVTPGAYDARVVVGGATDCSGGLADATNVPQLFSNGFATIAFVGRGPMLQALPFADDTTPTTPAPDAGSLKLYLRFLNAAPGFGAVDVGLDTKGTGTLKPLFNMVAFGQTSTSANSTPDAGLKVDNYGYLVTSALSHSTCTGGAGACPLLSVQQSSASAEGGAGGAVLASATVSAAAGAVVTIALVGDSLVADSGNGAPTELLQCVDNGATVGLFGNCSVLAR
jgi:hypothetical protein